MKFKSKTLISMMIMLTLLFSFSLIIQAADNGSKTKSEIFSWWTGGGEEEGLQALFKVFRKNYPNIDIINATVAGGAGSNAKAVLKTRMVGGNPPDSFQVHGGAELIDTYVKTGMMEPITDLLEKWGVKDKFNQQILNMCSYKGEIYAIPLDVHRGNVIFYNKAILDKNNITPPTNLYSFVETLKKLDKAGVTPLALGDKNKWTATQVFENILVATLGPVKYKGLWNGTTSFDDPGIKEALEVFKQVTAHVNEDHAALTWQDATRRVYDSKAAFNVMGDWAEGYLKTLGWTPGKDFGWMSFPGTRGSFMIITDSFGLPKGAPHPEGAKAWLKTVASVEGQDTFNPIKGAIPSRLDADKSKYDKYLTDSMNDFASVTLTPSIAHGSAAPEGFITALNDAINNFVSNGDVDSTFKAIQNAASEYLQ